MGAHFRRDTVHGGREGTATGSFMAGAHVTGILFQISTEQGADWELDV